MFALKSHFVPKQKKRLEIKKETNVCFKNAFCPENKKRLRRTHWLQKIKILKNKCLLQERILSPKKKAPAAYELAPAKIKKTKILKKPLNVCWKGGGAFQQRTERTKKNNPQLGHRRSCQSPNLLTMLVKSEVKTKRPRTTETLENVESLVETNWRWRPTP